MDISSLKKKYPAIALYAIAIATMLAAAFWNGYPLLYSDTSSYISSGFALDTLVDRPITYGIFLRITSLNGLSLWLPMIVQCLLLVWLMRMTMDHFGIMSFGAQVSIILATCIGSGLPFIAGLALTDVFTPIMLLSFYLLTLNKELDRSIAIFLYATFFLAFAMHISHLAIMIVLLISYGALASRGDSPLLPRRLVKLFALCVIGLVPMASAMAKSNHVFIMSRMAEQGILQEYLLETCDQEAFLLCSVRPISQNADAFLWDPEGPMKLYPSWSSSKSEFGKIIRGTLTSPKYILLHLEGIFGNVTKQLISFDSAEGIGRFEANSLLIQRLNKHFVDHDAYFKSKQFADKVNSPAIDLLNAVHFAIGIACAIVILMLSFSSSVFAGLSRFMIVVIIINSMVNAGLVMVAHRFGAKVAWLPVFVVALWVYRYFANRRVHANASIAEPSPVNNS